MEKDKKSLDVLRTENSILSRSINELKETYMSNLINMYFALSKGDEIVFEYLSKKNKYIFAKLIADYERRKVVIELLRKE